MKISTIEAKNLKCFKEIPVTRFSNTLNLFIGENNSGKSTILKSILSIQGQSNLGNNVTTSGTDGGYVKFQMTESEDYLPANTTYLEIRFNQANVISNKVKRHGRPRTEEYPPLSTTEPTNLFYPFLSKRKTDSYSSNINEGTLNSVTGILNNLSAKIVKQLTKYPRDNRYETACKDILGFVVSTKQVDNSSIAIHNLGDGRDITLSNMGEGVPNILGLITSLCEAENKIFVIEELENDLHPKQLKKILNLIIEKSTTNQFFVSTHSNIVLKIIGGQTNSKLFKVFKEKGYDTETELVLSEIEEITDNKIERRNTLQELGYEFADFELWEAWLILEESSAEIIIRDYIIPWYIGDLQNKLRTYSANSISRVKQRFEELKNTFVYLNLTEIYKNKVWVIIDDGEKESEIISSIKEQYVPKGWRDDCFSQFSKHDFEEYYPEHFRTRVVELLAMPKTNKNEKKLIREAKRNLVEDVKNWLSENPEEGKEQLQESAKEVIDAIKSIKEILDE